jgi:hypothetical protein
MVLEGLGNGTAIMVLLHDFFLFCFRLEIFEQGLSAVLSNSQDSVSLWCCFLEYLRRRVKDWEEGLCSLFRRLAFRLLFMNELCDWLSIIIFYFRKSGERGVAESLW